MTKTLAHRISDSKGEYQEQRFSPVSTVPFGDYREAHAIIDELLALLKWVQGELEYEHSRPRGGDAIQCGECEIYWKITNAIGE